jgi:mono/diheme cytochrome c family protein
VKERGHFDLAPVGPAPIRAGLAIAATCCALLGACSRPGGPSAFTQSEFPVPDAGAPPVQVVKGALSCTPAQSSQPVPPRSTVTALAAGQATSQANTYFTADLFGLFDRVCGGCHVDNTLGGFSVSKSTFPSAVTNDVYNILTSDDPAMMMPPPPPLANGMPFSQRPPTDAQVELASLLNLWLMQGSPPDVFELPAQAASSSAGYEISTALGAQLTNIGSCVPDKAMVAIDATPMDQLDATFSQATSLPPTLDLTDLTTLDSAALAQTGVISFAPTYPLWSDNAEKMRYVRVPRGQSIVFDKAAQKFTIPANTRFYKTFLKQVTDLSGNTSTYRKIETRLIVSRPDSTLPDGTTQQNALYGTYVWNDDETQATLLTDPLRDGQPFADRIFSYVTDEHAAQPIIDSNPANLSLALDKAGVTRHYALPGAERCVQCHEGSPSQSFVLGFSPLQLARRPTGSGGVYEPAMGDELTQLQRLIDYGVITGMASPSDVLPLESSEGSRSPRNDYELAAQAYMVGNCAHCHNPRGYPSIRQPAVSDVLIFLPGPGPNEGIFQFPLETMSPIRKRGLFQNVEIPYITPSLYDMPSNGGKTFCPAGPDGACPDCSGFAGGICPSSSPLPQFILAPWRSLIYRNTDTPFDYFDDSTPFPHMPLNTSGYDCRVAKLLGDWMVSIPSKLKDPTKSQSALPDPSTGILPPNADNDTQPYMEVHPGDSDYAAAVGAAAARLGSYHDAGFRYGFCPTTYTDDIIDPIIQAEADANQPITTDTQEFYSPTDPNLLIMPAGITPVRPHYISFDDTDPPGPWFPRRPDWASALVSPDVPKFIADETLSDQLDPSAAEDLTNVIQALQTVSLEDERTELLREVPFGLWDTTVPGCNFTGVPTAGSFTGSNQPEWMTVAAPPATAPVLVESAGASVFTTVCFNCHGIQADSKGLLADEITALTGGDARVANLRDGLLGPLSQPGSNRDAVFGGAATTLGITADNLAARYMAFMTLGGTTKHLPQDVLTEVSQSPVVGQIRSHITLLGTPDMLRLGLSLCEQIAGSDSDQTQIPFSDLFSDGHIHWSNYTGLVDSNGDAEMWLRLCSLGNRSIIHVPVIAGGAWTATTNLTQGAVYVSGQQLYWGTGPDGEDYYGANPVMDDRGNISQGVTASNPYPICIAKPSDPAQLQIATTLLGASPVNGKNVVPFCPDGLIQASHQLQLTGSQGAVDFVDGRKWAARGAINAALAVFLYLDQIERDPSLAKPLYTQCNLLGPTM